MFDIAFEVAPMFKVTCVILVLWVGIVTLMRAPSTCLCLRVSGLISVVQSGLRPTLNILRQTDTSYGIFV